MYFIAKFCNLYNKYVSNQYEFKIKHKITPAHLNTIIQHLPLQEIKKGVYGRG